MTCKNCNTEHYTQTCPKWYVDGDFEPHAEAIAYHREYKARKKSPIAPFVMGKCVECGSEKPHNCVREDRR